MTFEELLKELKQFENTDEYKNFISGLINDERVTAYLDTDSGKKLMQPKLDSYFSKGLETWKTNNLDKLVDEKIKELNPEADPKDLQIAKIQKELDDMRAESARKTLKNQALIYANEKGLPVDLLDFFIGKDEKATSENIAKFEKAFTDSVGSAVQKKLKDSSYVPPEGDDTPIDGVTAAFAKLNPNIQVQTAE